MDSQTFAANSLAAFDAFAGVEVTIAGQRRTLPALSFADGVRFMRLAERIAAGYEDAARELAYAFPRAIGLGPDELGDEDFGRVFERMFNPELYAPDRSPDDEEIRAAGSAELVRFTWDDLVAEYAETYHGPPRPDEPWPLVLALLQRMPRFESRARLRILDGVADAIASAFSDERGAIQDHREQLAENAYPGREARARTRIIFPPQSEKS